MKVSANQTGEMTWSVCAKVSGEERRSKLAFDGFTMDYIMVVKPRLRMMMRAKFKTHNVLDGIYTASLKSICKSSI